MAYKLKKGVFLRQIGLPPLCEWKLTDELAEKYLQNDPSLARYFAFIPEKKAVQPVKKVEVKKEVIPEPEIEKIEVEEVEEQEIIPEPEVIKPKRKRKPKK
jgi:hypothetical protein